MVSNGFFYSSICLLPFWWTPLFPISWVESHCLTAMICCNSADNQQLRLQWWELQLGAKRTQNRGLYILSACLPCRTVQAAILVTEQMRSSSFIVSALQVWERETRYSLESKGVANSTGIKYPRLKQSFIWTTITMNQQQIPQMIISQEPAQLIKSLCSMWAQTISSQHTPFCSKPLWSLPWYVAMLHGCSILNPAI